ncbi:MAG: Dihydrolipoyllysine-residue acetyltransferase component of pyruvate dehydrogenase complex, partial [Pseudomonadota bacterium]
MALVDIKVPDIGDFAEVAVIELMVKVGDTVKVEQSIITVESDKASMEIPSSHAGVVKEVKVAIGSKVKEGSIVLSLEVAGEVAASAPAPVSAPAAQAAAPVVAAVAVAASGPIEVKVPDIGDFKDVAVIEIFVKAGDTIKLEQSLMTVESDKAAMEIPSSAAGVVKELKVKLGDKVNIGDLIAILEGSGGTVVASAAPTDIAAAPSVAPVAVTAAASTPAATVPAHAPTSNTLNLPHASPSVRKFARELGVPLSEVKGSGNKGRITEQDVQQFTKSVMSGAI